MQACLRVSRPLSLHPQPAWIARAADNPSVDHIRKVALVSHNYNVTDEPGPVRLLGTLRPDQQVVRRAGLRHDPLRPVHMGSGLAGGPKPQSHFRRAGSRPASHPRSRATRAAKHRPCRGLVPGPAGPLVARQHFAQVIGVVTPSKRHSSTTSRTAASTTAYWCSAGRQTSPRRNIAREFIRPVRFHRPAEGDERRPDLEPHPRLHDPIRNAE